MIKLTTNKGDPLFVKPSAIAVLHGPFVFEVDGGVNALLQLESGEHLAVSETVEQVLALMENHR